MHRPALRQASLCSLLVSVTLALSAAAQSRGRAKQRPVAPPASATVGADSLNNVKFRNLGPSVGGGRVAAVVGVPGDRNTYYVGAGGGGVWKTTDGGDSWEAVFKDQPTASIGALALAPSNPNVVWVGTGEGNPRNDVVDGRGVFMSPDAGKSWQFMGLGDVGQISRIVIDPADPDVVFVAALGHVWAPNAERGVFRTADGGKTWHKVLFVNDTTGVSDLVMVPGNPRLLFAAMWQFVRHPWELVSGGAASGIYRSKDGGLTWERLKDGLPTGPLGRRRQDDHADRPGRARGSPRVVDRPPEPGPHDPGERRRRLRDGERRQELAVPQQSADRAVLHGGGRQQHALHAVRRAAGQQRVVRAVERCKRWRRGRRWRRCGRRVERVRVVHGHGRRRGVCGARAERLGDSLRGFTKRQHH